MRSFSIVSMLDNSVCRRSLSDDDLSEMDMEHESLDEDLDDVPPMPVKPFVNETVAAENRDPDDPSTWGKVGRNELCPCGSGKKYKHCHGALK